MGLTVAASLSGICAFGAYFFSALLGVLIFSFVYTKITPLHEWKLIKEDKNVAASIAFGGAILGYAISIAGAISESIIYLDFLTWAVVGLITQIIGFFIIRFVWMPKVILRITENEVAAGIMCASLSISVGIIQSACMTY